LHSPSGQNYQAQVLIFYFRLLLSLRTTSALKYGASRIRRIPRATTARNLNIRVVLVDALKQPMIDLKALRKKVAEAESASAAAAKKKPKRTPSFQTTTRCSPLPFRAPRD
jgi:hypothetical protein